MKRSRRIALVAAATVAAVAGALAAAAPAAALWSATGTATATTTAGTLGAPTAELSGSAPGSLSVRITGASSSTTLSPEYRLERSTSPSFASPTIVGAGAAATYTDNGNMPAVPTPSTYSALSTSWNSTCGISSGVVLCWGSNSNGQHGRGTTGGTSSTPQPVKTTADDPRSALPADRPVVAIAGGGWGTHCASTGDAVFCWGENEGAVVQPTGPRPLPVKVPLPAGSISSLTVGAYNACALVDGVAYCWGSNATGQLGTGGPAGDGNAPAPVARGGSSAIPAGARITAIRSGQKVTCFIADAVGYCAGYNVGGELGNGTTTLSPLPVRIATGGTSEIPTSAVFTDIAPMGWNTNTSATCALASGAVYCFGGAGNYYGGASTSAHLTPVKALLPGTATAVTAGAGNFCALVGGKTLCWGNNNGLFGNGVAAPNNSPSATTLPPGKTVAAVTGSGPFRCWLFTDGSVGCSGLNSEGQFGEADPSRLTTVYSIGTTQAPAPPLCTPGATKLATGACSLAAGTTYYYRATYTLGRWTSPASAVAALTTQP